MINWAYYCLTYRSPEKRVRMQTRFDRLGMQVKFWEGHHAWDPECAPPLSELAHALHMNMWDPHAWSVLQGHLMIMRHYLAHSDAPMLCVMEDDVHINKNLLQEQPVIQAQFDKLQLDVCMLGYLSPHALFTCNTQYETTCETYAYLDYPDNVYGTQMYLMHRQHVNSIWNSYGVGSDWHAHVFTQQEFHPADWIITKQGKRACMYPMMAVEEHGGGMLYQDPEQTDWHAWCHASQYDPNVYV
jgi:hypothetical protein